MLPKKLKNKKQKQNKHTHKQKSMVFIIHFFLQINIGEQKNKTSNKIRKYHQVESSLMQTTATCQIGKKKKEKGKILRDEIQVKKIRIFDMAVVREWTGNKKSRKHFKK